MSSKHKVALCRFPGNGSEASDCVTWLMQTLHKMKSDPRIEGVLDVTISDTPVTMSRNRAVKQALAAGCDYILMVDSDMAPDYLVGQDPTARPFWDTAWEFMMRRSPFDPPATIAAPYCGPPPHECCYVFRWKSFQTGTPDPNFKLEMFEREDAAVRAGIEEVAALPTGLILYHADVFRRLPKPWFDYEWGDEERSVKASTEDVYQTRNASLLGLPQNVAWDCWAQHVKTKKVSKPHVLTIDGVHSSLVQAVQKGHRAGERVMIVNRPRIESIRPASQPVDIEIEAVPGMASSF